MSRFEIKMPKLGESITEGTIISWSVKVGDTVQEDDVLFEVNTAKVSAEIPSPVEGKVIGILFKEGDTVPVGTVVAIVDIDSDEGIGEALVEEQNVPQAEETSSHVPSVTSVQEVKEVPKAIAAKTEEERWYSPIVLQLAQAAHISKEELDRIQGTGYEGRLSKKDIKAYITRKEQGNITVTEPVSASAQSVEAVSVRTSPTAPSSASSLTLPVSGSQEGVEVKEMDRVRKMIADHMVMSKHTFRREGVKLTYMPAITEAVTKALVAYPQVNVSVDGYNVLFKKHINVGIAVSLNDGNLIVPVIHDADRLNLNGLAVTIDTLAVKARDNKLMPDDISGGTFTITNFGTFKSLFGTPIINQPQVAILGVGYIEKKPAVIETSEGDVIAVRHKMYLSLSYDHRVVDGMLGGQFLYAIKDYLENWKE